MSATPLLDLIDQPDDLRRLQRSSLAQVADELRRETIDAVSVTGGHLGAGLGVVELTVALHGRLQPNPLPDVCANLTAVRRHAMPFGPTYASEAHWAPLRAPTPGGLYDFSSTGSDPALRRDVRTAQRSPTDGTTLFATEVDLSADVLFAFNSDRLSPAAQAELQETAKLIRERAKGPVNESSMLPAARSHGDWPCAYSRTRLIDQTMLKATTARST